MSIIYSYNQDDYDKLDLVYMLNVSHDVVR